MADYVLQAILSPEGKDLDPTKAAEAIVQEVLYPSSDPPVLSMPLGGESLKTMKVKLAELERTEMVFGKKALELDF